MKSITTVCLVFTLVIGAQFGLHNAAYAEFSDASLDVSANNTPVSAALAGLAKTSGATILSDSYEIDIIGPTNINHASVETILNALASEVPGLAWYKITLPASMMTLPSADTLSDEIHALRAMAQANITIVAADQTQTLTTTLATSAPQAAAAAVPAASSTPPVGMQIVYVVTNENTRAQRLADAAKAKTPAAVAAPAQTAAEMNNFANSFSQLDGADQAAIMPQLMASMRDMMMNISPEAQQAIGQQIQAWRNSQGGNGQ